VEDEKELCMALGDRLQSQGYVVEIASDGIEAIDKLTSTTFDLAIVDIMLPFRNGLEVCAEIRRSGISVPIIILTARSQISDKIAGLKVGADDYMCKPFDALELMARVEAQLRRPPQRIGNAGHTPPHIHLIGTNILDTSRSRVTRNGEKVNLTVKEYQLLCYLAEHRGKTISREDLLSQVWGQKIDTLTRTVDVHVASLRQKLEETPKAPELILTVPGAGYKLALNPQDSAAQPYNA
jgi:two-component system alkaline phosphatase synthesis response regulator PhoP